MPFDPLTTSFLATIASEAAIGTFRRILTTSYKQEVETAITHTSNKEGVSEQLLWDTLKRNRIQNRIRSSVEDGEEIERDILVEELKELAEEREEQLDTNPETLIDSFLKSLRYELELSDDQIRAKMQRMRQIRSLKKLDENQDILFENKEMLENIQQELLDSSAENSNIEISTSWGLVKNQGLKITDGEDLNKDYFKPFSIVAEHTLEITNWNSKTIENCRVSLDYFRLVKDHHPTAETPSSVPVLEHLQTKLPWNQENPSEPIRLHPQETAEIQFMVEVAPEHAIAFPSSTGLPNLATRNLYLSDDIDQVFPNEWWWLLDEKIGYLIYRQEHHPDLDEGSAPEFCVLRIMGSNTSTKNMVVRFDWEDWQRARRPLPVELAETEDLEEVTPIPIDIEGLDKDLSGITEEFRDTKQKVNPEQKPIRYQSHAHPGLGDKEYWFNDEYRSIAENVNRREELEYESLEVVSERLFDEIVSDNLEIIFEKPGLDELTPSRPDTDVYLTNATIKELETYNSGTIRRLLKNLLRLQKMSDIPISLFDRIDGNLLDRPIYYLSDEGIYFWTHPLGATPYIPDSVSSVVVELVTSEQFFW